jgi:hypothetical protein
MESSRTINFTLREQVAIKIGIANKPARCRNFKKKHLIAK